MHFVTFGGRNEVGNPHGGQVEIVKLYDLVFKIPLWVSHIGDFRLCPFTLSEEMLAQLFSNILLLVLFLSLPFPNALVGGFFTLFSIKFQFSI